MIQFLKKIFGQNEPKTLDFTICDINNIEQHQLLTEQIEALISKKSDGLILNNFLNHHQCQKLSHQLIEASKRNNFISINDNDGIVYPMTYSMIINEQAFEQYASMATKMSNTDSHLVEEDLIKNIITRFKSFFQKEVDLLSIDGIAFSRMNYRILFGNKNGINVHCENAFIESLLPEVKNGLQSKVDLYNILPYFIILDKPEKGGELIVFNEDWDDLKVDVGILNNRDLVDKEGRFISKKGLKVYRFEPAVGDLVIFRGAQLWHAINDIQGKNPRITMGGFVGFNKSEDKFYCWS